MDPNDLCKCTLTRAQHVGVTVGCLEFQLDRKATWQAEKERAQWAKLHRRRERLDEALRMGRR